VSSFVDTIRSAAVGAWFTWFTVIDTVAVEVPPWPSFAVKSKESGPTYGTFDVYVQADPLPVQETEPWPGVVCEPSRTASAGW